MTQHYVDGSRHREVDAIHPPFYSFGHRPEFMDAPANPHHPDMDWMATTFLTEDPRIAGSSLLQPLTGFDWGYRLRDGAVDRLLGPDAANTSDWTELQAQYAREYPDLKLADTSA